MRECDKIYKDTILEIINADCDDLGMDVRPKWLDGTPAHTISADRPIVNVYDLSKDFPMTSIRPVPFKKCVDELLWIWQKNSNNVKDLGSKIWDQWADENGSIGEAYGFVMGLKNIYSDGEYTQVERLIKDLKENPASRRMVTNLFVHDRLHKMNLAPCAYGGIFNVKKGRLNMTLIQRSNDFIVANSWNVTQYAVLVHLLAHCCDLKVGVLTHVIADCHIYTRHLDFAKEVLDREGIDEPIKIVIDTEEKDFFKIKLEDIKIIDYKSKYKNVPLEVAE